jgi:general secretion pathway protein D
MILNTLNKKLQIIILCLMTGMLISACSSKQIEPESEADESTKPFAYESGITQQQEAELNKTEGNANQYQLIPDSVIESTAIRGDIEYLSNGKADIYNVDEFRRLLQVEERPTGIDLNFQNADIKEVISLVIGKIMRENFLIDPAVKGTVTLKTEKPLNRDTVFYMLENILDLYNARIVKRKGHYRIFPKARGGVSIIGIGDIDNRIKLGYGYRIIPLNFVSATEMVKILESVTNEDTVIRPDEKRNLVIIGGTSEDVRNMMDAISMFDVDMMKGTHVGLIRINYSDANDIISDLKKMLSVQQSEGLLTLETIERLNAILVISRQYEYLKRVRDWVRKLDTPAQGVGNKLYVYPVQYTTAKDLASTLDELFGGAKDEEETGKSGNITGPGSTPVTLTESGTKDAPPGAASKTGAIGAGTEGSSSETAIKIIAAEDTNSLLISSTPNQYARIALALKKLDVPPLQVLIEVTIMDVQLTDAFSYGMRWELLDGGDSAAIGNELSFASTFNYSAVRSSGDVRSFLRLLASDGKVDVLSSPSILVRNNNKASIRVGDQQPISTSSIGEGGVVATSVEFKDTGILLEIKPSITSSGTINVDLTQEVIDVGDIDTATGQRTFLNRNLNTSASVNNGESIILGGLIRTNTAVSQSGVPYLRDIPFLGFLFGQTVTSDVKTELMIILSPRIIRDSRENNNVMKEYKEKFEHLDFTRLGAPSRTSDITVR